MLTKRIALLGLAICFAMWTAPSPAIDIPEGGDAIQYQLRASSETAIARLVAKDDNGYRFEVEDNLRGSVPTTFTLLEESTLRTYDFTLGQRYLLFLRKTGENIELATSIYSIQPVTTDNEVVSFRNAIEANASQINQPEALKEVLKRQIDNNVPYIQYSAVADLRRLHLLASSDISDLGRLLAERKIFDSSAKVIVIDQLARLSSAEFGGSRQQFIPVLERFALDASETNLVRGAAVNVLRELNATDALKRIAPAIASDPFLTRQLKAR